MAEEIDLTVQQIQAVAVTVEEHSPVVVRQLSGEEGNVEGDIYVTVLGTDHGHRVTPAGVVTDIGHTLPATKTP